MCNTNQEVDRTDDAKTAGNGAKTVSAVTHEKLENELETLCKKYDKTFRGLAAGSAFDEDEFFKDDSDNSTDKK